MASWRWTVGGESSRSTRTAPRRLDWEGRVIHAPPLTSGGITVRRALKAGRAIDHGLAPAPQGGTLSFSACDRHGTMAALTLTHGESFGSQVTLGELGLTLGHGMSRFETDPAHPNAPGPGKRPLHNMVPVIVTAGGKAVAAAGGRGGRRIPNAMLEFLLAHVVERRQTCSTTVCRWSVEKPSLARTG
jgi:gamma-glutamyltranspeptidase